MSRSRIAIFEGYNRPSSYGAPLFSNPRPTRYGRYGFDPRTMPPGLGRLGRRGYTVPPLYGPSPYGPKTSSGRRSKALKRRSYRVKKGPNSPWQRKFKKIAKTCARKARGRNARKGAYQSCMKKALRKAKRSKR
jgi:hypothetical protein